MALFLVLGIHYLITTSAATATTPLALQVGLNPMGNRPILALAALAMLSACASTGLGISREDIPSSLQPTFERAQSGEKRALFLLAIAFADGLGVTRDCERARKLLRLAAADSGGTLWVYSPPVGNGTQGRVIPINQGPKQPGLKGAAALLADPAFCPVRQ